MKTIAVFRLERRALGARKWEETSHTTSHFPSAQAMWINQTYDDALHEYRLVGEWVPQKSEQPKESA